MRRIHTNAPPNILRIEVYSNSLVEDSMRTCSANCERLSRSIILASQRQGRMRKNKTLKILGTI